jgi:hypothetical protein
MSEPTAEEIEELFQQVVLVLNGRPGNLQAAALSNIVAAFSISNMDNGQDPFNTARVIYRNAKAHIKSNLDERNLKTRRPRGLH